MSPNDDNRGEPDSPTDLDKPSLLATAKRAGGQFKHDNLTDLAAGLTYYAVLSIFPGVLVLVAIIGLLGKDTAQKTEDQVTSIAPSGVDNIVTQVFQQAQSNSGLASVTAIIGVLLALWSASGYVAGFMRASNVIYGIGEGRPIWKTLPVRLGVTVLAVVLLTVGAFIVVSTGPVAETIGNAIGLGDTAVTVWDIVKWPILLLLVSVILAVLYWAAPNAKQAGVKWVSPGGVIAVVLWLLASGLFALYLAFFANYNKTYGSLAAVIVFLVWLWITNIAILFGAEVNAELDHQKAIEGGLPEDVQPFAEPRDTRKLDPEQTADVERAQAARRS
ncbi:YihY/virulence factor BrkB family protein [Jatrophihabitans sp. YIM 134969]